MSETIEDCPFCGARVEIHRDKSGEYVWHPLGAQCFLDGDWAPITHWNRRWNRRAAPALSNEVRSALERTVILLELQAGPGSRYPLEDAATLRTFLSVSTEGQK